MAEEARFYVLSIVIEVRSQDDLKHFQPDSVVASAPQLGLHWVSGNDRDALREFFDFSVNLPIPTGMSVMEYSQSVLLARRKAGINGIVQAAIEKEG